MAVLINGNGNEAIYAQQDADWYAALMGGVTMITAVGEQFAYELLDANTIGVKDGVIITKEGRRIQVDTNVIDTFDIPTGAQGTTNYYIIGYHLVTDEQSVQTAETFVQLMENGTDTIPEGSFKEGDDDVYVSLYRVEQNDLTIGTLTLLLPTVSDSMQQQISTINADLYKTSVIVTANGAKTTATLLNELWALVDYSKITDTSYIEFNRGSDKLIFEISYDGIYALRYGHFAVNQAESLNLGTSSTYIRIEFGGSGEVIYNDKSREVLTSGLYFKLYY